MAEGAFLIGTNRGGAPIRLDAVDLARHVLVTGPSGSGKTTLLASVAAGAMAHGGGCVLVDGRSDPVTTGLVQSLAHSLGRANDVLVLDLSTSAPTRDTAGWNPFARATPEAMQDLLSPSTAGGSPYWLDRARTLSMSLMPVLAHVRDADLFDLDAEAVLRFLSLRWLVDLVDDGKYPDLPAELRAGLARYLGTLPGFRSERGYQQVASVVEHHAQVASHLMGTLGTMCADTRAFPPHHGDVDVADVVDRGRILVVRLPPAGTDRAAAAGRMALRLLQGIPHGDRAGRWPFPVLLDEVDGHQASFASDVANVTGLAVVASVREGVPTQAPTERHRAAFGNGIVARMRPMDGEFRPAEAGAFTLEGIGGTVEGTTFDLSGLETDRAQAAPGCLALRQGHAHALVGAGWPGSDVAPEEEYDTLPTELTELFPGPSDRVDAADAARRATAAFHLLGWDLGAIGHGGTKQGRIR